MSLAEALEFESDTLTVVIPKESTPRRSGSAPHGLQIHDLAGVATAIAAGYAGDSATVAVPEKRVSDVFLDQMRSIAAHVDLDASLDFAFRTVDRWLRGKEFARCDEVLRRVDVGAFHEDLLVGLLTITFAAKAALPSRTRLLERSAAVLRQRVGETEARRALVGLE